MKRAASRRGKRPDRRASPGARASKNWLPVLAIFAASILLRCLMDTNSDVSWDITAAEKMLGGARLYTDVIEVNPPATIYLYLPAVALARLLSVRPEWVVDGFVFLAAGMSLWFTGGLVTRGRLIAGLDDRVIAAATAFILVIFPLHIFAEREHVALIACLPALVGFLSLAKNEKLSPLAAVLAGIGAGIAVIVKPHLALGIILAAGAASLYAKSWRPLLALQNWVGAALCAVYALWVWIAYPVFIADILLLAATVYVPVKIPVHLLSIGYAPPLWIANLLMISWLLRRRVLETFFGVLLAASFGFFIAYLIQGKAWPYQSYPALALSFFVLIAAFLRRFSAGGSKSALYLPALPITLSGGITLFWLLIGFDTSGLVAPIRALKPHPKIIALSGNLGLGHPLTRIVGGEWVGRVPSLWITLNVRHLREDKHLDPAADAVLSDYAERDRGMFVEDIVRGRPDIVLLDWTSGFNWLAWAKADPALTGILETYRVGDTVDGVTILSRANGP
jgi:hypothetical protein